MVIRDKSEISVLATTKLSILMPLPARIPKLADLKVPDTLDKTPGSLATRQFSVCLELITDRKTFEMVFYPFEEHCRECCPLLLAHCWVLYLYLHLEELAAVFEID